ncbi:hypothetical protein WJX73_010685 [Symbiochloris irregularis]|uniref:Brix domain-containing protein n=1 Tax=Symbiochloris irregularis TaxID=706552 RepID=A0AAW1PYH3_9CHLO
MAKRKARAEVDAQPEQRKALKPTAKEPEVENGTALVQGTTTRQRTKEKVLILATRGITFRHRHLLLDLVQLLPHCKKDAKMDTKSDRAVVNEVADIKGCNNVLFFEARKHQDLYLWIAKSPDGPSVKFLVLNVHTLAELKLSGNHLKGSRPVLSFHQAFDSKPHLRLLKEMLTHVFATPKRHQRSKPFFDHVLAFSVADNRIWIRNYQVVTVLDKKKPLPEQSSLVEVGPRCCLNPIKIFAGSFGGPVLYDNPEFVSPNTARALAKRAKAGKYRNKVTAQEQRRDHLQQHPIPLNEFANVFR